MNYAGYSVRIDVKVVLLPGRVLVKIRDKDGKERREWWAEVLQREEIQIQIHIFNISGMCRVFKSG